MTTACRSRTDGVHGSRIKLGMTKQGIFLNIVVGIAGAFIGALIFYRGEMHRPVQLESFIVALLGSILLLALINLFRRGRVR